MSEMDDPRRFEARSRARQFPLRSPLVTALTWITDNLYKMPRLAVMVRNLREQPGNDILVQEILALLQSMSSRLPTQCMDELIDAETKRYATSDRLLTTMIDYPTHEFFATTVLYYLYRLGICGITLRLFDTVDLLGLIHVRKCFDRAAIETEEIRVAELLAMSTEYAFRPAQGIPFKPLNILTPITMSYGPWKRLLQRTSRSEPTVALYAMKMKKFVWETICRVTDTLYSTRYPPGLLESLNEAWTGGPPVPSLSRRGATTNWNAAMQEI